jgi:type VI protein secretion system component VasK
MNTQTHSKSLILPIDKRKVDRNVKICSSSVIQAKKCKFLFTLTVLTWIVAVFLAIAFYVAVRKNLALADLLACILLGMVFLGWIILASYFRAAGTTARSTGKRERNDQHHPAPTATAVRAVTRKDRFE